MFMSDYRCFVQVWFVCKHDAVPGLLRHIDKSLAKLAHPPTVTTADVVALQDSDVLLDPLSLRRLLAERD